MTYGARSPWRFSRMADLAAARPRCVPTRDMRGMFHRTTLVANDRVLARGGATVHINAGPRYVPNAAPARLMAVAPQAFPQRRILPQRGVNIGERPWIRAATGGGMAAAAAGGGPAVRGGAGFGVRTLGRATPAHAAAPTPPPRIYNPPRAFASTLAPHGYSPPVSYGAPRAFGAAPAGNAPHTYNPVRTYGAAPASNAPHMYNPPAAQQPRMYGAPPSGNLPRVYSPPPRTFAQPPAQRAPAQSFRPAYTPPPAYTAPHNFSPPAPSFGGGGFGHPGGGNFGQPAGGGGAHFGGGGRRR